MRRRKVASLSLPFDSYAELYRLARLCRAHSWRSTNAIVVEELQDIFRKSGIWDGKEEWSRRYSSAYFYEHFIRRPNKTKGWKPRLHLVQNSGVSDEGSATLRNLEREKNLGSFYQERLRVPSRDGGDNAVLRSPKSVEEQVGHERDQDADQDECP